jgi:hypothetical protein
LRSFDYLIHFIRRSRIAPAGRRELFYKHKGARAPLIFFLEIRVFSEKLGRLSKNAIHFYKAGVFWVCYENILYAV